MQTLTLIPASKPYGRTWINGILDILRKELGAHYGMDVETWHKWTAQPPKRMRARGFMRAIAEQHLSRQLREQIPQTTQHKLQWTTKLELQILLPGPAGSPRCP
jgi:hypothetical protein